MGSADYLGPAKVRQMTAVITSLLSACLVVWAIEQARHMSRCTRHMTRIGVVIIGSSAMAAFLSPLYSAPNAWVLPAFMTGAGMLLWADRRNM